MAAAADILVLLNGPKVVGATGVEMNVWLYRSADAQGDLDAAGYFAVYGSTSGTGVLNSGDVILTVCTTGPTLGLMIVTDAAAGTAAHLVVTAP